MMKTVFSFFTLIFLTSCMSDTWRMKEYTVAVSKNAYPMSFLEDGELVGYEIDLLNEIAEELRIKINFKPVHRTAGSKEILDGDADIAAGGLLMNEKMRPFHLLSSSIFEAGSLFVCPLNKASSFNALSDFKKDGLKVGVLNSESVNRKMLSVHFVKEEENSNEALTDSKEIEETVKEVKGMIVKSYAYLSQVQSALLAEEVDVFLLSPLSAWSFANSPDLEVLPKQMNRQDFSFYYSLKHKNLHGEIENLLKSWAQDGTLNRIAGPWFDINLQAK